MTATISHLDALSRHAHLLLGVPADYDSLLHEIGDASLVLIGEATHGTHEFYELRAQITRRLIEDQGFNLVCAEADWPDAYRVNRFVRGGGQDHRASDALRDFTRFPRWMWRNTVVRDFVTWLRERNAGRGHVERCGFYGVDLYSLYGSIDAVIRYLEGVDPEAARAARERYGCFERFDDDPQRYGYAASMFGAGADCEDEVVQQLVDLRRHAHEYLARDGYVAQDEQFFAEMNAVVATNAERYYRQMFSGGSGGGGRVNTWNLRDTHMADTIDALATHYRKQAIAPKIVVWEHNSHLGDARATYMHEIGEHNVGQLMRERHGRDAYLIGFTTYAGAVTAADDWDGPARLKRVRPGLPGSYEELLHDVGEKQFSLNLRDPEVAEALAGPLLERAIGVIYRPQTERASHYFDCRLPAQFDTVIHLDETRALEPLDLTPGWRHEHDGGEDTYPFGV